MHTTRCLRHIQQQVKQLDHFCHKVAMHSRLMSSDAPQHRAAPSTCIVQPLSPLPVPSQPAAPSGDTNQSHHWIPKTRESEH